MYAQTDDQHADRIQIFCTPFLGPFTQVGPLGNFDPRRDLVVYVDGDFVPVRSFFFDPVQNRYLLFMDRTINVHGVVQVLYHMPSPSFLDNTLAIVPSFALVATFVPTADDLYVNLAWFGGVPDIEILVNGVVVSEDYVISVSGS